MSKEIHDRGDKMVKIVHDLIPADWDQGPLGLAHEIRQLLKPVVDENTGIDSGGSNGMADLWATIDGVEYYIAIRRSDAQLAKDGKPRPGIGPGGVCKHGVALDVICSQCAAEPPPAIPE